MEELAEERSELLTVESEDVTGSLVELIVVVNVVSESLLEADVVMSLEISLLEELSVTSDSLLEVDVVTSLEAGLLEEDVTTSLEVRLLEELSAIPLSEVDALDEVPMLIGSIMTSVEMALDVVISSLLLDEDNSVELADSDVVELSVVDVVIGVMSLVNEDVVEASVENGVVEASVDDGVAEDVSSVEAELVEASVVDRDVEASKSDVVVEDMSSVDDDVVEASTVDNLVEDVSSVEDELVEASVDDDVIDDVSSMKEKLVAVSLMELEVVISTAIELMLESAVVDMVEDETELLQVGVKVVVVEVTGRHEHALVMDGPGAWFICRLSR
ncbi:uncharacterized protein AB675_9456 [Cyphellophora attinorum]|uniref:Uncharacterized protein n=1 Tax=Cyphellophora attinorum TaxID=1664694 RepID=A0A0N1HWY8_9EURO|nr:uncharacterized protein AB675_9456 [Phialophora attinorum]KPI42316.1 hypothetical protein AB675_9456 [Phialophora attinorum]